MKWLFVVVLLCLFVSVGSSAEFTDTFQHQTAITDNWEKVGWGSGGYVNDPIYHTGGISYNKECELQMGIHPSKSYVGVARNKYPYASNYWSYYVSEVRGGNPGYKWGYVQVYFWNEDQSSRVGFTTYGPYAVTIPNWLTINQHLEFQYESGSIYWKINIQ
jgi:hypothetical protein